MSKYTKILGSNQTKIQIAIGKSRYETSWKNTEMTWAEFTERLSKTQVTHETHAEFIKLSKKRQDEIKDVGAFVGGYLSTGRRKAANVLNRQLITLDLDYATGKEWGDITTLYDFAVAMYSTHKHTPERPRLRLVAPIDRPVTRDEYEPIARRIADWLGIDSFDDTTYQPERLMYWPSTSKNGEFFYQVQDGPWLSADEVLATYKGGWQDSSQWPTSSRTDSTVGRKIKGKKQQDPLEKNRLIGAFCKVRTIQETIETYLSDVYEEVPGSDGKRFTYKEGSTSGGLIIYEDKFAYSHHGTDPVSGELCNAFDLVRLHRFGVKDEGAHPKTNANKLPSFLAMQDLASSDKEVKLLMQRERDEEAKGAFEDIGFDVESEDSGEWKAELDADRKGNYYSGIDNIVLILIKDANFRGKFVFDEFEQREIVTGNLPWRKVEDGGYSKDSDVSNIKYYLKTGYGIEASAKTIAEALEVIFERFKVNPVQDYLNGLSWDKVPRLDTLLIDYLGAEDTPYIRAVTRKTLTAAVARAFKPGTKFDNMLTLVGPQGVGKSTLINKLAGQWFRDTFSFNMLGKKESYEQLQGAWLIEVGEMAGLKKAEVEAAKSFITSKIDSYRVSYGRRVSHFPRRCVLIGTTNDPSFLSDPTGNRRFWPVRVGLQRPTISVFGLSAAERGQIWAEAVHAYRAGETLFLSQDIELLAARVQSGHTQEDERIGAVMEFLEELIPDGWEETSLEFRQDFYRFKENRAEEGTRRREYISGPEIFCELFGNQPSQMTKYNTRDVHDIMKGIPGWRPVVGKKRIKPYGNIKYYERVAEYSGSILKNDVRYGLAN